MSGGAEYMWSKTKRSNQGHKALAKAALWLDADRGERKPGDMQMPLSARNFGMKVASKEKPGTPQEAKQEAKQEANQAVPPQSARQSRTTRRASFDNICGAIAEKASQKFKNTREAFRFIDEDHDGTISPTEMRYFFRAYDFGPEVADAFFNFLDVDSKGEISYDTFVAFMSPHFNDVRPGSPTLNFEATDKFEEKAIELVDEKVRSVHRDFADILYIIGNKVPTKFPSLRHVWRYVDNDHDGKVSRSELRAFFRAFNIPTEDADRLFDRMLADTDGDIFYEHFVKYLGPCVAPDATDVSSILKAPKRSTSVVTSPRDPSIMRSYRDSQGSRSSRPMHPREYEPDKDPELRNELKKLIIDIGRKLPLKFKHQRDAFRMLDLQRDGRITITEMRGFFRGFGWGEQVADRVFDILKEEPHGQVDFKSFMSHFDRILGPQFRQGKREPLIEMEDKNIEKEVNDIAAIIQDRLTTKYKSVQDAFRAIDLNKDGTVSQFEMKTFFRNCGMSYSQADKVFLALDADGSGEIQYDEFISLFGAQRRREAFEQEQGQPLWKIYGGAAFCI